MTEKKKEKGLSKPKRKAWKDQEKYQPKLTEVVEETEPESSFKETAKVGSRDNKGFPVKKLDRISE